MSTKLDTNKDSKDISESISTFGGFVAGGLAACGAVTFTNPIELIKIRMQLQGELVKSSKNAVKLYENPIQAFFWIYRNEGIRGLQQGLVGGYCYQLGLNGCRIGLYEPSRYYLTKYLRPSIFTENGNIPQNIFINVFAGFLSGSAGAVLGSPFFLVKTRMQSYSKAKTTLNVGQQTYYKSVWDGLASVYKIAGVKGLFRGVDAAILRTGAGSAAQLPVYYYTKNFLLYEKIVKDDTLALHFLSSLAAGVAVAIVMNPWDVVLTRVYNQRGDLYSGPIDCFAKTIRAEGFGALYKGFWAQLLRVGPHSILTLMFMERCMKIVQNVETTLFL